MGSLITAHNLDAEQALLGILMESPQLAETCGVSPGDLSPAQGHDVVLAAIMSIAGTVGVADPTLLLKELAKRDQISRIGGDDGERGAVYLHTLFRAGQYGINLAHYAGIVREATIRRRIYEVGTRLVQTATGQADLEAMLDTAGELSVALQMTVDEPVVGDTPIAGLSSVTEFVSEPSPPYSWVVPGLIEHADRVMLVGGEGTGKSVLSRQVALLLAAGRHPFSPKSRIPAKRTLLVDLENPPSLVRRKMRGIVGMVHHEGLDLEDRAWRWNRPGGLDLRSAAGRALFTRAIEETRPDLICVGPLYKMSLGRSGDSYETAAGETAAAMDQIRERYGCAFWIEHHLPKGDGSAARRTDPIGSSYWLRWPEFGLVLRRDRDAESNVFVLDQFRGHRDERTWPERLIKYAGPWPWTADYDPETSRELDRVLAEEAS